MVALNLGISSLFIKQYRHLCKPFTNFVSVQGGLN
jgi:hypothetical protein